MSLPRDQTREMKFWFDPRLAIMAVRRIAPLLVHLDPEDQELYLDNEIRLVQKLKGLEPEIAVLIAPLGPLPAGTSISYTGSPRMAPAPPPSTRWLPLLPRPALPATPSPKRPAPDL